MCLCVSVRVISKVCGREEDGKNPSNPETSASLQWLLRNFSHPFPHVNLDVKVENKTFFFFFF